MKKRLLAILLAVIMVAALGTVSALAAEGETEGSQEAVIDLDYFDGSGGNFNYKNYNNTDFTTAWQLYQNNKEKSLNLWVFW